MCTHTYLPAGHPWIRNYNNIKVPLDILIFKLMKPYMRSSPLRKAALRVCIRLCCDNYFTFLVLNVCVHIHMFVQPIIFVVLFSESGLFRACLCKAAGFLFHGNKIRKGGVELLLFCQKRKSI